MESEARPELESIRVKCFVWNQRWSQKKIANSDSGPEMPIPPVNKDFDRMVMHNPENIEKQEEKQWQCGYKVEASLNDRILSDKGYLR